MNVPLRGVDRAETVDGTTETVDDAAKHAFTDGNANSAACVEHFNAAGESLGGLQRDGAHHAGGMMLHNLNVDGRLCLGHEQRF